MLILSPGRSNGDPTAMAWREAWPGAVIRTMDLSQSAGVPLAFESDEIVIEFLSPPGTSGAVFFEVLHALRYRLRRAREPIGYLGDVGAPELPYVPASGMEAQFDDAGRLSALVLGATAATNPLLSVAVSQLRGVGLPDRDAIGLLEEALNL